MRTAIASPHASLAITIVIIINKYKYLLDMWPAFRFWHLAWHVCRKSYEMDTVDRGYSVYTRRFGNMLLNKCWIGTNAKLWSAWVLIKCGAYTNHLPRPSVCELMNPCTIISRVMQNEFCGGFYFVEEWGDMLVCDVVPQKIEGTLAELTLFWNWHYPSWSPQIFFYCSNQSYSLALDLVSRSRSLGVED